MNSPDNADAVVVERTTFLGMSASVRMLKWLVIVLFVATVGSIIRSESVQDSADVATAAAQDTRGAAEEARDASRQASADLAAAIEASGSDPIDPALIDRSLKASIRAECILDREFNNPDRECEP